MISYAPLAKTLFERNVKRTELARKCRMSNTTLAKLNKNESVTLTVIEKMMML